MGTLNSGSISDYYQFIFPSNGITLFLNVSTGSVYCYASDRYENTNEELYDWTLTADGYADIFINPSTLGRTPGTYMYVSLKGIQSYNSYSLNSEDGDRRGIISNNAYVCKDYMSFSYSCTVCGIGCGCVQFSHVWTNKVLSIWISFQWTNDSSYC